MRPAAFVLSLFVTCAAFAQQLDAVSESWTQPVQPFRIAGNLYYVGASDLTSFLITTPQGHILLDGGFEKTAPLIRRSIETLGFRISDVKILLNSHAHFDHAGGLMELKRASGAQVVVMREEAALLARGGVNDPQFGDRYPFPGVYPDRVIRDRDVVRFGNVAMTAHRTAGHTRGCTTWQTTIRDGNRTHDVVFLCSPSVPTGYRLVGNPAYPDAIADYRAHFARLKSLTPDIWLGAHGAFFDLAEKTKTKDFVDPEGYRRTVESFERRFEKLAAEQQTP